MLYLLQVTVYTAAMLLIYNIFLRNKVHHQLSRIFLLLSAVLPLIVPLIQVPILGGQQFAQLEIFQHRLPELIVTAASPNIRSQNGSVPYGWWLYFLVVLIGIVIQARNLFKLRAVIKTSPKKYVDGCIIITESGLGPGSFGNYIFLRGEDDDPVILAHEKSHISMVHTADILVMNLIKTLYWPNLFLHLILKELREVHEFQADSMLIGDKDAYAALLLGETFETKSFTLIHSFIHHPIKRRIMMLKKTGPGSSRTAILKVTTGAILLLSAGILIQSCARKTVVENDEAQIRAKILATPPPPVTSLAANDSVLKFADKLPQFLGDNGSLSAYLQRELHYPQYARSKNIEGRVAVQFVISKTGKVTNPVVVRSPDTSLSRAALEVVAKMPDWQPAEMNDGRKVNMLYTQPITFKLQ